MFSTGEVRALTTAADFGAPLVAHDEITLVAGVGITGDRHAGRRRQVTIVCTGELAEAAALHGVDAIDGVATRRNIVVDTPSLPRTHGAVFRIGAVEFAVWRDCAPCELMDETFGAGAKDALRNRCGISATVVTGGTIRVGDRVSVMASRRSAATS
jgi:MOSC domain-containing protein YiiM